MSKSTITVTGLVALLGAILTGSGEFMLHFDPLARFADNQFFLGDIKSRITDSETLHGLNDQGMEVCIQSELDAVRLGANTFDERAIGLVLRSVQGNLRACRNLCYGSMVEACRENKKIVSLTHVNNVLVQPHWRSHEALIKQQAD